MQEGIVAGQSEGEAQAGRHHATCALSEDVADIGHESRHGHGVGAAVAESGGAYHHEHAGQALCRFVPPLVLNGRLDGHGDHDADGVQILDKNLVLVYHLVFNRIGAAVLGLGGNDEPLRLLVVGQRERGVRLERHLLLEGILVARQLGGIRLTAAGFLIAVLRVLAILTVLGSLLGFLLGGFLLFCLLLGSGLLLRLGYRLLEALVHLLEEGEVVVERLHVEVAVDVQLAVVRYGVAQRRAVGQLRAAHPVVGGRIAGIRGDPVEDGQLVQRQLVAGGEGLPIVERAAEVLDAGPYGVFPCRVAVGIEVFVDGLVAVGFLHLSLCARLEVQVQRLGDIPAQREVAVPEYLRVECRRHLRAVEVFHVALLQLVVVAYNLRVEGDVLRQIVQPEGLGQRHPLRLALRLLERLPRLIDWRVAVVQRPAPLVFALIDGGVARRAAV